MEVSKFSQKRLRLLFLEYRYMLSKYEIEMLEAIDYPTILMYGQYIEYYDNLSKQIEGLLNDYQYTRN